MHASVIRRYLERSLDIARWAWVFTCLFVCSLGQLVLFSPSAIAKDTDCQNLTAPSSQQILRDVYGRDPDSKGFVDVDFGVDGPRRATVWQTFFSPPEKQCAVIALTQSRLNCPKADNAYCPEDGFDSTGRSQGAEIGVALYEGTGDQLRLANKNAAVASWGNWNKPPHANSIQITWLRDNVALVTSGVLVTGPVAIDPSRPNQICHSSSKRLVGILVAPNLIKEAMDLSVNTLTATCPAEAGFIDAIMMLHGGPSSITPKTAPGGSLPNLEVIGLDTAGIGTVRMRRIDCSFYQGKYTCARR